MPLEILVALIMTGLPYALLIGGVIGLFMLATRFIVRFSIKDLIPQRPAGVR